MAMPRKELDPNSDKFEIRFALHLRKLLKKHRLTAPEFCEAVRRAGLDVSPVTIWKWLRGERLPLARDFEQIGEALGLRDYRQAMPPPA